MILIVIDVDEVDAILIMVSGVFSRSRVIRLITWNVIAQSDVQVGKHFAA